MTIFICLLGKSSLFAQNEADPTYQYWLSFSLMKNFANSFLFYTNPEYYDQFGDGDQWRTYAWTNGVEYYPNGTFDVFGYFFATYTVQASGINTWELRPVIGGRWNILNAEKRVTVNLEVKYESRNFYSVNDENWTHSNRFRSKLQARYSLNRQNIVQDRNILVRAYVEEHMNVDENIEERYWNNRALGLGAYYRHSGTRRYELRYILMQSKNTLEQERFRVASHIFYVLVTFFI